MKELFDLGLEMGDLPNSKVVWRKYAEQKVLFVIALQKIKGQRFQLEIVQMLLVVL